MSSVPPGLPKLAAVAVAALLLSALLGAPVLAVLRRLQARQVAREDAPASHQAKAGTPFMGGIGIIAAFAVVALLAAPRLGGATASIVLLSVLYGLVGFTDDYLKLVGRSSKGWKARYRLLAEALLALAFVAVIRATSGEAAAPVAGASGWLTGWPRWVLDVVVIVGAANAVNLTDGLDGLAAGCTAFVAVGLGAAGVMAGQGRPGGQAALALGGAAAGFLWWNARPARVFMGDVGRLALGAALGGVAVAGGLELVLAVMGGVFVLEALSVMAQVVSFRTTGRRLLRMAPFHHHLELCGWSELRIVRVLWAATAGLTALGLAVSAWLALPV